MSFLQPFFLLALPLILLPIIIHLVHLKRRRAIKWAAMMFLQAAQRMNQGLSKLRQYLILALRVLAIAALILMAGRPLAGGLLGLTGGAPDTVILLLDRSASMEQQNLATGKSKRETGLKSLSDAVKEAYRDRSRLVLIDSASLEPKEIEDADALRTHPNTSATATTADIPGMLQAALDHITTNQTGRTDVWLLSDLRQNDWNAAGGRWEALRAGFVSLPGVRFHILSYPETAPDNLSIVVEKANRRKGATGAEVLLDVRITRQEGAPETPIDIPLRVTLNGVSSTLNVTLKDRELFLQGQGIPLDISTLRGWGSLELPADSNLADNRSVFVFGEPAPLRSVIVTDLDEVSVPLKAALNARLDPNLSYQCDVLTIERAAEIEWEKTALVIWHSPIPDPEDILYRQLLDHAAAGRALIFLPPTAPDDRTFAGLGWAEWKTYTTGNALQVEWWRNDAGLLANTRAGTALPVGEISLVRQAAVTGEGAPLARTKDGVLMMRSTAEGADFVWFLGTLPGPSASSLARDGIVQFALLHRALEAGVGGLGDTRQRIAARSALGSEPGEWTLADLNEAIPMAEERPFQTGVFKPVDAGPDAPLTALNRPVDEDQVGALNSAAVEELFDGLDARYIEDTVDDSRSLASEIWRTFLLLMAIALIIEALLTLPRRARLDQASSVKVNPVSAA